MNKPYDTAAQWRRQYSFTISYTKPKVEFKLDPVIEAHKIKPIRTVSTG